MTHAATESRGRLIATALNAAWRAKPSDWSLDSAELEQISTQLFKSGVGALIWRRLKSESNVPTPPFAEVFQQQYRLNTVLAAFHAQKIEQVVTLLQTAGVRSLLIKGWAAARLYPNDGLRPYTDIDIIVEPQQFSVATKVLEDHKCDVDLHAGLEKVGGGSFEEVFDRSETFTVGAGELRVPSPEDHLRILAIHMLREGAWRPLWLCDVAAAVESRPENFDWEICLGRNRRWSNWVNASIKLARELLGANISGTPADNDRVSLPRWLVPTVLREWGATSPSMALRHRAPMTRQFRSPASLVEGFRHRWPNPIEGTIVAGALISDLPRFPFQLAAYLMRGAKFAVSLPLPHGKS